MMLLGPKQLLWRQQQHRWHVETTGCVIGPQTAGASSSRFLMVFDGDSEERLTFFSVTSFGKDVEIFTVCCYCSAPFACWWMFLLTTAEFKHLRIYLLSVCRSKLTHTVTSWSLTMIGWTISHWNNSQCSDCSFLKLCAHIKPCQTVT